MQSGTHHDHAGATPRSSSGGLPAGRSAPRGINDTGEGRETGKKGAVSRRRVTLLALLLALGVSSTFLMGAARVVEVPCGGDLDEVVNADPPATATLFELGACNYTVDRTVLLKNGDGLVGPEGTLNQRYPAVDPDPVAEITGVNNVSEIVRAQGGSPATVSIEWVSISGAVGQYANGRPKSGTGSGLSMGSASDFSTVSFVRIHDNEAAGVLNARGTYDSVELDNNATNRDFVGFNGSGLKAITEIEVKNSYVHDNAGNGLWCDVGCKNASNMANGFWVHHNLVVNNERGGIRYENSPTQALIEYNEIHGNSFDARRGGVSIRDSQNALVRFNVFGTKTIAGVSYPNNDRNVAVMASDSGKASRTDLRNVQVVDNDLKGDGVDSEVIRGCELPDNIVACSGNT